MHMGLADLFLDAPPPRPIGPNPNVLCGWPEKCDHMGNRSWFQRMTCSC